MAPCKINDRHVLLWNMYTLVSLYYSMPCIRLSYYIIICQCVRNFNIVDNIIYKSEMIMRLPRRNTVTMFLVAEGEGGGVWWWKNFPISILSLELELGKTNLSNCIEVLKRVFSNKIVFSSFARTIVSTQISLPFRGNMSDLSRTNF